MKKNIFALINFISKFSDSEEEMQWKNYYTDTDVDTSFGTISKSVANGDTSRNCGLLVPPWNGWADWLCRIPKAHVVSCACEHPGQMYLQLRGLCPDSNIDRFYIPNNKKRSGAVQIISLKTTIIEFEKDIKYWKMTEYSQNTTALIKAPLASFALGSHQWLIENDNEECSENGEPYERVLKLTGCREGEFTCNDGQCIR